MRNLVLALAAAAALPAAANAATFDALGDFSSSNPSSAWAYGSGVGGTSFTAFSQTSNGCFGAAGFVCHSNGDYLGVGVNGSGNANPPGLGTVNIPNNLLWLHPDDGAGATDSIVQFTAATSSTYSVSGLFQRLTDAANNGNGNGVIVSIYNNGTLVYSSSALAGSPTTGATTGFNFSTGLTAGDKLSFVVNNNGGYGWDSTGLAASIAAVPEPAQWALMIAGFGLVGGALRSRRRGTILA